jgi:hypothetical protein
MGSISFDVSKDLIGYYWGLPAANDAVKALLLQSAGLQADAALADHATIAALLGSNTEATFTNYARKTLTTVARTPDTGADTVKEDADDLTWTSAGGASNNTLGKLVVYYDPDTTASADANNIPLLAWDYTVTTDGVSNLLVTFSASGLAVVS